MNKGKKIKEKNKNRWDGLELGPAKDGTRPGPGSTARDTNFKAIIDPGPRELFFIYFFIYLFIKNY